MPNEIIEIVAFAHAANHSPFETYLLALVVNTEQ